MASSQAPRPDAPGAALPVRDKAAVVLALALVFIWSLPGTIALRMLLLLAALALVLPSLGRADWRGIGAGAKGPLLWLALLSAWLVFQALAISPESAWALSELRGQWLNALIALALGLALGWRSAAAPGGASRLATGIALALAALALIAAGQSLAHGLSRGELLRDDVPFTGGRLEMSFLLNLLFAFVLADLAGRATGRGRLLAMPAWAVGAILVLACLVHYLAGARNGILVSAVLAFLALGYLVHARRERLGRLRSLALAGALVLAGLASLALTDAARWRTLAQTARLAWDIDAHAAWRDSDNIPLPRLPDGRAVEHSPYTRIAFLHAGLRELARAPLGVGYGRNALRHALQARAQVRLGHTHSGILDLALGGGVPAVVLWFGFLFASARAGWIALRRRGCVAGMLLLLLVLGYAGRMLVDSVNRDHMLQMFFFLAGTVLMLVLPRAPVARTPGDAGAAGE